MQFFFKQYQGSLLIFAPDGGQLMRGRKRGKRTKLTSFNKDHVFLPFLVLSVEQEAEL